MRSLLITLIAVLLAGCDYTVPLVGTPTHAIDPGAVGLWQQTSGQGAGQRLLVLPMDEREYLIAFPSNRENTMYARATLWKGEGMTLAQINWFGTAFGSTPDNQRTYQYAKYDIEGGKLTLRLLNPNVIAKDIDSSARLAETILKKQGDPALFRKPLVFTRVEPQSDRQG